MAKQPATIRTLLDSLGRLSSWMHQTKRWPVHGDLTMHQAVALHHIIQAKAIRPGQLADLVQTSPGATTSIMDQLVRRRLITRQADPTDRRGLLARPTDKALEAWPAIEGRIMAAADTTFGGWEKKDLAAFQGYIERLLKDARPPKAR